MALRIRLARGGSKKKPFYRIVVAENTSPRDGKFVERLGSYNPLIEKTKDEYLVINEERAKYWLSIGAQYTERVQKLLSIKNIVGKFEYSNTPKKSAPKKKAQERLAAISAAKAEKEEPAA